MREKEGRYVSHKSFLPRCVSENVIPNGFRLELEPTIGIQNVTFLNNWYEKPQQYSLEFMKDIITFCDKTIAESKAEIKNRKKNLKTILENNTFHKVQKSLLFQSKHQRSLLKITQAKRVKSKYEPRPTQQYSSGDKATCKDQTTEEKNKFQEHQL